MSVGPREAETDVAPTQPTGVVSNSASLLVAQGLGLAVSGGVSVYAIRSLDKTAWGNYSTATALVAIFAVLSGLGIAQLTLREMAGGRERGQAVLSRALGSVSLMSILALALAFPATLALGYSRDVLILVGIAAPLLLLEPGISIASAAFNAQRVSIHAATVQAVRSVVYAATAVVALEAGGRAIGMAAAATVAALASAAVAAGLLRRRLGLSITVDTAGVTMFLLAAAPVAGISIIGIIYDRLDVLMLSKLADVRAVATYSVAYTLVTLTWVLPSAVGSTFFPVLSSALSADEREAERLFFLVVRLFLFLGLPVSLLLAVGGPTLVGAAFGARYAGAVGALQVIGWVAVIGFENYALWYGILAARRERLVFALQAAGLALNCLLNALLIPPYGPSGAAGAFLGSELLVVAGQLIIVHRYLFRVPLGALLLKPAIGALLVVPPSILFAQRWSPLGCAVLGALAYAGIMVLTSYIRRAEWRPLKAAVAELALRLTRRSPSPG